MSETDNTTINVYGGYVRRRELTCTEAELTTYASKVLLKDEFLWVQLSDGKLALKRGDGIKSVSQLPYVLNIADYIAIKTQCNSILSTANSVKAQCETIVSELTAIDTSPSDMFAAAGL